MADKKDKKKPAAKKAAPATKPAAKAAAPARPENGKKTPARERQPRPAREPRPERQAAASADTRPAGIGIHDPRPAAGATHYRKGVGRGPGSGHGKTAGRGNNGPKSRSGYGHQSGFEGGET